MITRARAGLSALFTGSVLILGFLSARPLLHRDRPAPPRVSIRPADPYANGYDIATLLIDAPGATGKPRITIVENPHGAVVQEIAPVDGQEFQWQAQIRIGVMPGRVALRVQFPNLPSAVAAITTTLSGNDSFEDGTPDYLRLDTEADRSAFRRWFTYIAEEQYFQEPANRPTEINDCAALIRYAYRESLHAHESGWAEAARLPIMPAFPLIDKYQYPYTPLGASLFRVAEGPYRPADLNGAAFAQFADAQTLWRYNTHRVARELKQALPGDLLFFRQDSDHMPFHSMIYLGESQLRKDRNLYVLYHTGPDGSNPGEIRRLTLDELLQFPQPEWRPIAGNPYFLGVFRWNILRKVSDHDARY